MHIPDAVLSPSVAAATSLIGAAGLSLGSWKLRDQLRERTMVLMGTMSPFVFAAQMVNFPLFPLPISGQVLVGGVGIAIAVAVFLAPFASEHADGLEWVGGKLGFLNEETPVLGAPIPDYQLPLPGVRHVKVATAVAGLVGTLTVFAAGFILAGIFARRTPAIVDPNATIAEAWANPRPRRPSSMNQVSAANRSPLPG